MGSEGRSINPSTLKVVDAKTKLSLLGDIESLNVSATSSAFVYEVLSQRIWKQKVI